MAVCQIRNGVPEKAKGIEWILLRLYQLQHGAAGVYPGVPPAQIPDGCDAGRVHRQLLLEQPLINALTDAHYGTAIVHVERYQAAVVSKARALLREYDGRLAETEDDTLLERANEALCTMAKQETTKTLNKVLLAASQGMKNGYSRGDN